MPTSTPRCRAGRTAILRRAFEPKTTTSKVVSIAGGIDEQRITTAPWPLAPTLGVTPKGKEVAIAYKRALTAFRRCLKLAGIERTNTATEGRADGFGLHTGRHTFCSLLVAAGVSPAYVSRQAGHHDIGFTVRVYGASLPPAGSLDALSGLGHQMDTSTPKGTTLDVAEARL